MRWETDADQLIEDLKMQESYQIKATIPGGGLAGKYRVKPWEKFLDESANAVFGRPVSNLTRLKAEEIAEENSGKLTQ